MKNPWIIIGIITVVLFGGAIWYADKAAEESNEGVEVTQHIKGNPEADVTLVEYGDFQCPACQAFHPIVQDIMDQYGDDLRFEFKHFPLPNHQHAVAASMAAEAAGQQGEFYAYHDRLFENQSEWSSSASPDVMFVEYAEELDLDVDTFRRQMKSSILRDKVQEEMTEGRSNNVTGTPTFFLNGEQMQFDTYEGFTQQVAEAVGSGSATTTNDSETEVDSSVEFGL